MFHPKPFSYLGNPGLVLPTPFGLPRIPLPVVQSMGWFPGKEWPCHPPFRGLRADSPSARVLNGKVNSSVAEFALDPTLTL